MLITVQIEDIAVSVACENEENMDKIIAKTLDLWKKVRSESEEELFMLAFSDFATGLDSITEACSFL